MVGLVSDTGAAEEAAADAEVGREGHCEGGDNGDVCGEFGGGRVGLCGGEEGEGGGGEGWGGGECLRERKCLRGGRGAVGVYRGARGGGSDGCMNTAFRGR